MTDTNVEQPQFTEEQITTMHTNLIKLSEPAYEDWWEEHYKAFLIQIGIVDEEGLQAHKVLGFEAFVCGFMYGIMERHKQDVSKNE